MRGCELNLPFLKGHAASKNGTKSNTNIKSWSGGVLAGTSPESSTRKTKSYLEVWVRYRSIDKKAER